MTMKSTRTGAKVFGRKTLCGHVYIQVACLACGGKFWMPEPQSNRWLRSLITCTDCAGKAPALPPRDDPEPPRKRRPRIGRAPGCLTCTTPLPAGTDAVFCSQLCRDQAEASVPRIR